jgi:hypothetical protein
MLASERESGGGMIEGEGRIRTGASPLGERDRSDQSEPNGQQYPHRANRVYAHTDTPRPKTIMNSQPATNSPTFQLAGLQPQARYSGVIPSKTTPNLPHSCFIMPPEPKGSA